MDIKKKGSDGSKESPVGKIEGITAELNTTVVEALEIALAIEGFLLGPTSVSASEQEEKKSPCGWLDTHFGDLRDMTIKMQFVLNTLRNVKGMTK